MFWWWNRPLRSTGRCCASVLAAVALLACAAPESEPAHRLAFPTIPTTKEPTVDAPALPSPALAPGWSYRVVRGDAQQELRDDLPPALASPAWVPVLLREAVLAPVRYRVVVIPGSGCTGFAPWAQPYFAGLLHAQVWVLHKPGVHVDAGASPAQCPAGFVERDALASWLAHAQAALSTLQADSPPLRTWLVGISEGGELLAPLAVGVSSLAGAVLLGASGWDPREAGALQAQRMGVHAQWTAIGRAVQGDLPDSASLHGRTLRYWRQLWRWPVTEPLLHADWPLLQAWGSMDAAVPPEAYQRFAQQAQAQRQAPWCTLQVLHADHGLQGPLGDGVQRVWAALEQWERPRAALLQPPQLPPDWSCHGLR